MTNRLSRSLSYGLMVPAAFSLAACSGQATTAEQQPAPKVEISKSTIVTLFETAFVGTKDKKGCLWGEAYDTNSHVGEAALVSNGFQQAIPRVYDKITSDNGTSMYVTPRGNDELWIGLNVSYNDGKVRFTAMDNGSASNYSAERLTTFPCERTVSVPYQP